MNPRSTTVRNDTIPPGEVIRYTYPERLCHWLSGLSYLYCLISGLALFTPYLYWLAALLGGGPTARFWHPWAGVAFIVSTLWMHSMWNHDMSFTDQDRQWMKGIRNYVTNRDELLPQQGRFNAGQKQFYWVMYYGAIVLFISGLVMWFPELTPRRLNWVRGLTIVIHECAALITIGAFIIHIYMGVFAVPGGLRGIVSGHVTRRWAKTHHPLWYTKVTGDPTIRR